MPRWFKRLRARWRHGILARYAHVIRPTLSNENKDWASEYIVPEFIIPGVVFIVELFWNRKLTNADIIVSALGVLGGLLFAHAIFVFQLRMEYTRSVKKAILENRADSENTDLSRQIDELFDSVVYCSALADNHNHGGRKLVAWPLCLHAGHDEADFLSVVSRGDSASRRLHLQGTEDHVECL